MRIVAALGGNALLRRGEDPSGEAQGRNVAVAAAALAELADGHELVVTHGNGPQVGLLALQAEAAGGGIGLGLDVLGAETEGMIGYLVARELRNALPDREVTSVLTQVEVAADDPAFEAPTKPIGPYYSEEEARRLARERGWSVAPEGGKGDGGWRRVVASPEPGRILDVRTLRLLARNGVLVVCAGGGGIPVTRDGDGRLRGAEAVIDKDLTASLLAREVGADALLLLTDVDGIYRDFGGPDQSRIERIDPAALRALDLPPGSMGPKAEACARFVDETGGLAGIGALEDAARIVMGERGTRVMPG